METLRKFVDEQGVKFPLISDTDKNIKSLYGRGRVTYLIDKDGFIRFIQEGVPNNQDFINQLKALK